MIAYASDESSDSDHDIDAERKEYEEFLAWKRFQKAQKKEAES